MTSVLGLFGIEFAIVELYVSEDLVRRGVAEGQYAFLAKPFSGHQLMAAVQAVLDQPVPTPSP